jgi:4-amino-4-deoxy-L-arabinose transferase-like glycosyltransferase
LRPFFWSPSAKNIRISKWKFAPKGLDMRTQEGFRVSLVLPTWNDQNRIGPALQQAIAALDQNAVEYEILVVDDGSTDGTLDIVRAAARDRPCIRLIQHPRHLGCNVSLRTGLQAATLDLVVTTSADQQCDLQDLAFLLPLTSQYAIVHGYRVDRPARGVRRILAWGYNSIATALTATGVRDLRCPVKVFRRQPIAALLTENESDVPCDATLLAKARLKGLDVVEVGVRCRRPVPASRRKSWLEMPRTLFALVSFWWSRLAFPAAQNGGAGSAWGFWAGLLVLGVLAGALLFSNRSYPFFEPDEGRRSEIAREMLVSGNWVVSTLNYIPYYDKPPLFHWLEATSFACFGSSEASARLVPALAAFLTILVIYVLGRRCFGTLAAFLGGLSLTLMGAFIVAGRIVGMDGTLTLLLTVALLSANEAVTADRLRWRWWLTAAIFCGLGILTKGPVAVVLLCVPIAVHTWLNPDLRRPSIWQWIAFLAVAGAVVLPWLTLVLWSAPQFAYEFVVYHNLQRFTVGTDHVEDWWYYLPVLALATIPCSLLFPSWLTFVFSRSPQCRTRRTRPMGLLVLYTLWCVLFFSMSESKLPLYILPALPTVALAYGYFLKEALFGNLESSIARRAACNASLWTIITVGGCWSILRLGAWNRCLCSGSAALAVSLVCAVVLVGATLLRQRLGGLGAWCLCTCFMLGFNVDVAHNLVPSLAREKSPLAAAPEIAVLAQGAPTALVCSGQEWGSLHFACRGDVFDAEKHSPQELVVFVQKHARTVIAGDYSQIDLIKRTAPAGMRIVLVRELAGGGAVIMTERAAAPWYSVP